MRLADGAPRAWQRMLSGRRLDILDPSPLDVEIDDIAHGLARLARWNGQTSGEYVLSVAQHCCLVEAIAGELDPSLDDGARLAALLHDAPEYVLGDVITPVKAALGERFGAIEHRLLQVIHLAVGLPPDSTPALALLIKKADRLAAWHEATALAGFSRRDADAVFGRPAADLPGLGRLLEPMPPAAAESAFRERVRACRSAVQNPRGPRSPHCHAGRGRAISAVVSSRAQPNRPAPETSSAEAGAPPPGGVGDLPFEKALAELEEIVRQLEGGRVPLEESIAIYERGEVLKRHCEGLLRSAEARIERVALGPDGRPTGTVPLDPA